MKYEKENYNDSAECFGVRVDGCKREMTLGRCRRDELTDSDVGSLDESRGAVLRFVLFQERFPSVRRQEEKPLLCSDCSFSLIRCSERERSPEEMFHEARTLFHGSVRLRTGQPAIGPDVGTLLATKGFNLRGQRRSIRSGPDPDPSRGVSAMGMIFEHELGFRQGNDRERLS